MAFHTVKLQEVRDIAEGTKMFCFEKPVGFTFQAGQYVAMRLRNLVAPDTKTGVRSLSMASAPCEDFLGFGMRQSESGFKKTLWAMDVGDTVEVTDAVGSFIIPEEATHPVVFLIGGIGITPVRSILLQAAHDQVENQKEKKAYTLFFCNRFHQDAPYREELGQITELDLKIVDTFSKEDREHKYEHEERGYITRELLEKHLTTPKECIYYLVGSPAFITAMEDILTELGLTKESWHTDPFTGLESKEK
jgi:ferredoxin-NADP reductase